MAKKKKKKKGKKRSRMSGVGSTFANQLATVAGVVGGAFLDRGIALIPGTENLNKYYIGGGKVALGMGIPYLFKGKNRDIAASVGAGIAGVGALNILSEAGMLSGADDPLIVDLGTGDDSMNADVLAEDVLGADDLSFANGVDDLDVMNGML